MDDSPKAIATESMEANVNSQFSVDDLFLPNEGATDVDVGGGADKDMDGLFTDLHCDPLLRTDSPTSSPTRRTTVDDDGSPPKKQKLSPSPTALTVTDQLAKIMESSSDSDSSDSESSGEEDASDAADDLPDAISGRHKRKKGHRKQQPADGNEAPAANKPNKSLPLNGLVDEATFRSRLNRAAADRSTISQRTLTPKERADLPITSYLVVGDKRCLLPYCDAEGNVNTVFVQNIRKELSKLAALAPAKRAESPYLQPGPLAALLLHRANALFATLWSGMPGVSFKGGVKNVDMSKTAVTRVVQLLSPEIILEDKKKSIDDAAKSRALREHMLNQHKQDEEDGILAGEQAKVVMSSLLDKIRARKQALASSTTSHVHEVLLAKQEAARKVHEKAQRALERAKEEDEAEMVVGESRSDNDSPKRRSVSAPTLPVPRLGSFGGDNSDSDDEFEFETQETMSQEAPVVSPTSSAKRKRDKFVSVAKSIRHGFRMFRPDGKNKKKKSAIVDGQSIREAHFKQLKQVAAAARLASHAHLQGYDSFEQWKEAERKEAAQKGMDEAQAAVVAAIERKVQENQRAMTMDISAKESDASPVDAFIPAPNFDGSRVGYVFKMGVHGIGYYADGTINAPADATEDVLAPAVQKEEPVKEPMMDKAPVTTMARLSAAERMAARKAPNKTGALDKMFRKSPVSPSKVAPVVVTSASTMGDENDLAMEDETQPMEEENRPVEDETQPMEDATCPMEDSASSSSEEASTDKSAGDNVDRAAAYRAALAEEARLLKAKKKSASIFEDEAEESDDENTAAGVGEYSLEDKMRREQLDKLDARMDRVTEKDILDADLDGIVDAPSDDEGDENADVDGYHADRIQEQDDEEVAAVVKNIQEGWASRRSGRNRRRGQLGPDDLVEGNKRQTGRLRLDRSDDEDDEDEESALLNKLTRERLRHGDVADYFESSSSEEEETGEGVEEEHIEVNPENLPHEFDEGNEHLMQKRLRDRARKARAMHILLKERQAKKLPSPLASRNNGTDILQDEKSNHILSMVQRTNVARAPMIRQDSMDGSVLPSVADGGLLRRRSSSAGPIINEVGMPGLSAGNHADGIQGIGMRRSFSMGRGSFLNSGNSMSASQHCATEDGASKLAPPPSSFGGSGAMNGNAISRKFVFKSKEDSRSGWSKHGSGLSRPSSAISFNEASEDFSSALWQKLCQNRFSK